MGDLFEKFLKNEPQDPAQENAKQRKERKESEALRQFIDGFKGIKR